MAPSPTGTGSGELLCRRPEVRERADPGGTRREPPPREATCSGLGPGARTGCERSSDVV